MKRAGTVAASGATSPATGTIYGLVDPKTNDVRYVGQTVKPIEVRLAGHLAAPAPRVRAWIEALAVEGRLPEIVPIREEVPVASLDQAEREEIKTRAGRGELLNTVGNEPGNARRRKISKEEAKRREAEEEAMNRTWRQASWRQVADQVRAATGGPISPADVPIRDIPARVWSTYLSYRDADRYLKEASIQYLMVPGNLANVVEGRNERSAEAEAALGRRTSAQVVLDRYLGSYCGAFSSADDADHRGSGACVVDRAEGAYRKEFSDANHMARYLSLIPWAARALAPWADLAEEAGMDVKGPEFVEWVSDDQETRDAIELYRRTSPGWLGVRRQRWDTTTSDYVLALGAAHIPGFVTPQLLARPLQDRLTESARDRQATQEMCQLLQRIDPRALNVVYGRDALAESDDALGLPSGTSALVIRQIYGDSRDPSDRAAKLLQRHTGAFDTVAVPDYADWTGPHVPAFRVAAAGFYAAGLLGAASAEGNEFLGIVKASWKPTSRGLEYLQELEDAMLGNRTRAVDGGQ